MSHVTTAKVVIKDMEAAKVAFQSMGGTFHEGKTHMRWFGNFVDDSTNWKSMFAPGEASRIAALPKDQRIAIINKMMSSCDHTVSFSGAGYEVGLCKNADGTFSLRWDFYDRALGSIMGTDGGKFNQAYATEYTKRQAKLRGYMVKETKRSDGQRQLEIMLH